MTNSSAGFAATPPGDSARGRPPILVAFAGQDRQNRVTVLFRLIMMIPHIVALYFIDVAVAVMAVIGWFGALFLGRLPNFAADFLGGMLQWWSRFLAYGMLLTDVYPPFAMGAADYPVQVAIRPGRLNRLTVLFRLFLAIPAYVVIFVLMYGANTIALFVTWVIVLVNGRMPATLYQAYTAVARSIIRFYGYVLMLDVVYPWWGMFGDLPRTAGPGAAGPGVVSGEPGYGTPGQPGYGTVGEPGYGSPGQPGYGTVGEPGYGTPGQPEQGMPGSPEYGAVPGPAGPGAPAGQDQAAAGLSQPPWQAGPAPAAVPAVRWPREAMPWRLALSRDAKRLVAGFLALGVVLAALYGYGADMNFSSHGFNFSAGPGPNALPRVEQAHASLGQAVSSFSTTSQGCASQPDPQSCLSHAASHLSGSFRAFGTSPALDRVSASFGPAGSAARTVQTASAQIASALTHLASAKSLAQYETIVSSTGFRQNLDNFDTDYQNLVSALSTSR